MKKFRRTKPKYFLGVLIVLFIITATFFYNKTSLTGCSNQRLICQTSDLWNEYKDSKNYQIEYEANLVSGEVRRHILIRSDNNIGQNKLFINGELESETIYTQDKEYSLNISTKKFVPKPISDYKYAEDTIGYSLFSSSQKLTNFIMENSHLFSFQDLGKEDCVDSTCKKFQVTQTTNTTPQDLINNGMDKYSAENLPHNNIFIWIDLQTLRIHRLRTEYQDTYRDLTYNYNPPQINIPQ